MYHLSAAGEIFHIYINFKRLFFTKLTHLCTEFQKLDHQMYARFGFQNPPWLDHHGIQVFIGVPLPPSSHFRDQLILWSKESMFHRILILKRQLLHILKGF